MTKIILVLMLALSSALAQNYTTNIEEELVAVGISGARITPGSYRVSPDQRVLDVIKMANDGKLPPLDTIDCRQIILSQSNGQVDTIDLLRFLNTGDLTQNPYVTSGQTIRINFATEWVYISGDIQGALLGNVPLKRNETAGELLSLYTPNATADLNAINLESIGNKAVAYALNTLHSVPLKSFDALTVFPQKDRQDMFRVELTGEVKRPGIYSIEHGKTTTQDLLLKAGGTTDFGNIENAWLVRDGKRAVMPESTLVLGIASVKPEIENSLTNGLRSGDFLIYPLRYGSMVLENGDKIMIPKREQFVYVSGKVAHPGGYPFAPNKSPRYYIKLAGGYSKSADRGATQLIETYGNVYRVVSEQSVASGNIIMIPERDNERRTRFMLGIITSVASVLTSAITLASFIQNQDN